MNALQNFETPEIIAGFRSYVSNFDTYADMAQIASNDAESYRNFDVGVTLIGILPGETEPLVIAGANYKIDHGKNLDVELGIGEMDGELIDMVDVDDHEQEVIDSLHSEHDIPTRPPKNCGEMMTYWQSLEIVKDRPFYMAGLILAATTNKQEIYEVTELHTRTLTPCGDVCVPALSKSPHTSRATLIASTGYSWGDIYQVRTLREIERLQKTRVEPELPESMLPRLHRGIGNVAVELFDRRIKNTHIIGRPSRIVSAVARQSLVEAGRQV